ncbi:hypothetical protein [Streptomyces sp. NPDC046862]|uniref:hypothetical protein n=1 Tax=Streptomyces sp. NPDC046862 TaxID=3154603 RepID=UPI003454C851
MAFGTEELRVLRRALALALNPASATAQDVQDCLRLARSVDETAREGTRLRAFLLADLARYRAALPGTATGYLALLDDALGAGHRPTTDDLAALRALRGNPTAAALLDRCLDHCGVPAQQGAEPRHAGSTPAATVPASRTRLTALPGGLSRGTHTRTAAQEPAKRPGDKPARQPARPARPARPAQPAEKPAPSPQPQPKAPSPSRRPIPTPGEVFPPKRKPGPPANPGGGEQQRLAAG